jgi:autoinducer 2 (AI-2) kinase
MKKNLLLGIDIGGGSLRCLVFNAEKKEFTIIKRDMSDKAIYKIGDFGYGLDPDYIFECLIAGIKDCLSKGGYSGADIGALSLSALRHTLVMIDEGGKVLFASPNRDARSVDATMKLNDTIADEIYSISGHRPMPNLLASKLIWLKDTKPEIYIKTKYALSLQYYLNYRLTGKVTAERTQAGETMLIDLKAGKWSDLLIKKYGLNRSLFPEIVSSGTVLGHITSDAAKALGISEEALVIAGAGDSQSALLGLNAVNAGNIGVVAGTTSPIQLQSEKFVVDPEKRLWTGFSAIDGMYVLESNGGGMGIALEWAAGLLFADNPRPVAAFIGAAEKAGKGAGGVISTVGAQIFNNSVLSLPIDQLMFSTTNYNPESFSDKCKVARGVIEGMAFAVKANIEQLSDVYGSTPSELVIGGGMSRDKIWNDIIAEVTRLPVINAELSEASAVGAAVCAAVGAGLYKSLKEASAAIANLKEAINIEDNSYEREYEEWKEMYRSSFETNMSLGALINELRSSDDTSDSGKSENLSKLKIYADADISGESVEALKAFGTVTHKNYRDGDMLEGDEMIATLKDYDVFITEVDIVDAAIIKALPNLRMIGVCRGNPTNIDIDACTAAGIPVVYTPGRNSDAVADLTVAHILSAIRMLPESSVFLKEEGSQAGDMGRMGAAYFRYQGMELWNTTVGIIGGGAIGKKVAKRLLGFDAKLLVFDPYISNGDAALMGAQKVSYDELLSKSDIVTVHAPVTESTKNMVNQEAFSKMKDGAYFINTARAALVDYDALLEALKSGKLRGAGLDVFPVEPPAWNDPLVQLPNVLCTPHIAGDTVQVSVHQGIIMAENIKKLMHGEMTSDVVNRKDLKSFSFTGEKKIDKAALEKLKDKAVGVSDLEAGKESVKTAPVVASTSVPTAVTAAPATVITSVGYDRYMTLIKEFLNILSADEEVKQKTANKDISFQITFKDNEESCYMYFKAGTVLADLGLFPSGPAEVNLRMPIEIFDGMMRGKVNGAKAAMTGQMSFTGNVRKAMSMQSILKLMMTSYQAALDKTGDIDVKALAASPVQAKSSVPVSAGGTGYGRYMALIKEFLSTLSSDEEVKQKTASKDISFQITFKDNEESCYMYFKAGTVLADLGLFPSGPAEVNLRMPIEIFDGMMRGKVNGAKAAMTGQMSFTGNVRKAMSMQSILKLMMASYEKALKTVGDLDVTKLSAASPSAPESSKDKAVNVESLPAVQGEKVKKGLFAKLFGKNKSDAVIERVTEKIIYAGEAAKPKTGDVRDEILQVTNELFAKGLITGIGGNISARCEDNPNHVWITPSSVFKGDLRADMMVRVDLEGNTVNDTELSASSEKMVHLAIYKRRPEIMSVIHSHAPKATLMALTGLKFAPISTDAAFIGDIPIVPFVIPGSPELGDMVGEAIGAEGAAVLMQNHGLVVAGNSPRRAADTTEVVELTAEKIIECELLKRDPILLPKEAQDELASIGKMLV